MISWKILLLIFLILVSFDKVLTAVNIIQVNKNFPEAMKDDPYKIERNPLAKWFFQKAGLFGGTIVYLIISVLTLFIAYWFLSMAVSSNISLYILVMAYSLVIGNNFYFMFKYSGMIP